MDAEQLRIEEDLRGQIEGDVHCDDLFTHMYASDASIFELPPLGVSRPNGSEAGAGASRAVAPALDTTISYGSIRIRSPDLRTDGCPRTRRLSGELSDTPFVLVSSI